MPTLNWDRQGIGGEPSPASPVPDRLAAERIIVRQTPYEIKVS